VKISAIEAIPITVPIKPELVISSARGTHDVSPFVIVRVHTDEGVTGLGEVSCTPIWSGEDQMTAVHFIATILAPALTGHSPLEIERVHATMHRVLAANPFTRAAIETACWDILGKVAGLPLYRLWGGPVRERVPIKFSLSGIEPERVTHVAEYALGLGFRAMKVKVGGDPEADVRRYRAVREVVGTDIRLGADANGGWTVRQAIDTVRRLEEYSLWFIEQPVPPGDPTRLAEVRAAIRTPLLADESVSTPEDALALIRAGAADALSAYVGMGAGPDAVRRIGAVARAGGIGCTLGSNLELGIASAAMTHLAAATNDLTCEAYPPDILGPLYYEAEILAEPLDIRDGSVGLPTGPGLGVTLNEAVIARYRV
jgi:L-alanine-DL-glutamate epimerase-like enolase superfamily enzyme